MGAMEARWGWTYGLESQYGLDFIVGQYREPQNAGREGGQI